MFTWTATWQGTIYFEKVIIPNEWTIKVHFNGEEDDAYEEQIAFDRCRFLIEECYQDSMFIKLDDPNFGKLHGITDATMITIPEDPVDSAIAIATLSKFACITEGRLFFETISISSRLSDGVELNLPQDVLSQVPWLIDNPIKSMTGEPAWFMRSNAGVTDLWLKTKNKHEVVRDMDEWTNNGLGWNPDDNKKAELPAEQAIIRPRFTKGWKPKVIDGGKK
jgi:hypothetical protein